jgi:DNA-binding transcriptional ArsR family regulator
VNAALGSALTAAGWSWADAEGNFDVRAPGLLLRQRQRATPPRPRRTKLPQGSGSLAIIRALIGFGEGEDEEATATALAAQAKVSQPRASQVLHQLGDLALVHRTEDGRWSPERELLLDRFLADYRGPEGSVHYLYSLDPPADVAVRAASISSTARPVVVSADVGPDLLLAWRRPSVLILYAQQEIEPSELDLVEAGGRQDANVIIRNPRDVSVFPVPPLVAGLRDVEVPLADPSQQIWDLGDLGGADRLEAAGMLREWLLNRR